jgi:xanthine dehydrogenase YagS FAD-binding subunit
MFREELLFLYKRATSFSQAATLLAEPGAQALGGGTDLLVCIDEGITAPSTLVDLRSIDGGDSLAWSAGGALRISAAARVSDIASDARVREHFPALAQACEAVGSPALRHMGTIGGNLCQRPRCWYFRRGIPCLKNGGTSCHARDGENQYHAILDGGPCFIVQPSDPAVALTVLDAKLELTSRDATRTMPIATFYVLPRDRMDQETVLLPGEIVSAIVLDGAAAGGRQLYRKVMQRGAWDFALASIAAVRRADGAVRVALGGVAPRPWRVPESVEEDIASGGLDEDSVAALAERAFYDAEPLSKNAYKVALASSLLRDAMRELAA